MSEMKMSPIVEFIYVWTLQPKEIRVRGDDGMYDYIYSDHSIKAAIQHEGDEEPCGWGLPSGRRITCKEVNEFLRKYMI